MSVFFLKKETYLIHWILDNRKGFFFRKPFISILKYWLDLADIYLTTWIKTDRVINWYIEYNCPKIWRVEPIRRQLPQRDHRGTTKEVVIFFYEKNRINPNICQVQISFCIKIEFWKAGNLRFKNVAEWTKKQSRWD